MKALLIAFLATGTWVEMTPGVGLDADRFFITPDGRFEQTITRQVGSEIGPIMCQFKQIGEVVSIRETPAVRKQYYIDHNRYAPQYILTIWVRSVKDTAALINSPSCPDYIQDLNQMLSEHKTPDTVEFSTMIDADYIWLPWNDTLMTRN